MWRTHYRTSCASPKSQFSLRASGEFSVRFFSVGVSVGAFVGMRVGLMEAMRTNAELAAAVSHPALASSGVRATEPVFFGLGGLTPALSVSSAAAATCWPCAYMRHFAISVWPRYTPHTRSSKCIFYSPAWYGLKQSMHKNTSHVAHI